MFPQTVRAVFSHFQNLNLLVLLEDLRRNNAVRGSWSSVRVLCPVAHGLSDGQTVDLLGYISQADDLDHACRAAARNLGARPEAIRRFVAWWDSGIDGRRLLEELEALWMERLEDAEVIQLLLRPEGGSAAREAGIDDDAEGTHPAASRLPLRALRLGESFSE